MAISARVVRAYFSCVNSRSEALDTSRYQDFLLPATLTATNPQDSSRSSHILGLPLAIQYYHRKMAPPAAPRVVSENPFDDINAIENTTHRANLPSTRVPADDHGDTEATGVRSRQCNSICIKIYKGFKATHNRRPHQPMWPIYLLELLAACFCVPTWTLDIYGSLAYIPVVVGLAAVLSSFISVWALDHLTMPLCITTYAAVFVVTVISYLSDKGNQPDRRTPLIVIMSVWCAVIPVVGFLAWSFCKTRIGVITRRNQQSQEISPSQNAIELARLPREPLPAVLHPPQQFRTGLSVDRNHAGLESRPLSSVSDDGFQRVREFV